MPYTPVEDLGNTDPVKAWLDAGEVIQILDGDQLIARILPMARPPEPRVFSSLPGQWADFLAQLEARANDRILPGADLLIEERENSRY